MKFYRQGVQTRSRCSRDGQAGSRRPETYRWLGGVWRGRLFRRRSRPNTSSCRRGPGSRDPWSGCSSTRWSQWRVIRAEGWTGASGGTGGKGVELGPELPERRKPSARAGRCGTSGCSAAGRLPRWRTRSAPGRWSSRGACGTDWSAEPLDSGRKIPDFFFNRSGNWGGRKTRGETREKHANEEEEENRWVSHAFPVHFDACRQMALTPCSIDSSCIYLIQTNTLAVVKYKSAKLIRALVRLYPGRWPQRKLPPFRLRSGPSRCSDRNAATTASPPSATRWSRWSAWRTGRPSWTLKRPLWATSESAEGRPWWRRTAAPILTVPTFSGQITRMTQPPPFKATSLWRCTFNEKFQ